MMRVKSFIAVIFMVVMLSASAFATQLPKDVKDFVINQKDVPSVRFDGLINYSDGTIYLPVIPTNLEQVDELKIKYTIPNNTPFAKKPDIVIFNNNYGLIKLAKNKDGFLTAPKLEDVPFEIRTGLIPQDMLVPTGLVFPANLSCVLGNVQVPVLSEYSVEEAMKRATASAPLPTGKRVTIKKLNVSNDVKNKIFFVNNYQSPYLMVFSPNVAEPLFELKTSGVIKDVKPAMGGKYLLVASANLKNIDVVDIKNEYVARKIDLTDYPTEIVVDDMNAKAYVACGQSNVLSIIDMNTMTMKEKIQLIGSPQKMVLTQDGKYLIYADKTSSSIYIMGLDNYENRFIANVPNITKMIEKDSVIYLISRTKPEVVAINYDINAHYEIVKTKEQKKAEKEELKREKKNTEDIGDLVSGFDPDIQAKQAQFELSDTPVSYATSTTTLPTGNKPIDMVLYNGKLYVLTAETNTVYTYSINPSLQAETTIPTQLKGFSTKISQAENTGIALIMNMTDHHFSVLDMDKNKILQVIPINKPVNSVTVTERL